MKDAKGIMIFCQCKDGEILTVSKQLLGKGRELAQELDAPLTAAFIGYRVRETAQKAADFGAEEIYVLDHKALETYTSGSYAEALEQIVGHAEPEILLVGATEEGRDLAARSAAKLKTGLTADCTMLEIQPESRLLLQTRPAYGGRVTATIVCREKRPQMATVREGVFPVPDMVQENKVEVTDLSHLFQAEDRGIYVKEKRFLSDESRGISLDKARIVVAAGRGVKDSRGMALVQELAEVLGGAVAVSRGAVEDGLAGQERQVGQTGRTIRPDLYIACGISGASQHLAGIEGAKKILAVNRDPEAPIMKMADYALCADVFEALPELNRIAREIQKDD